MHSQKQQRWRANNDDFERKKKYDMKIHRASRWQGTVSGART